MEAGSTLYKFTGTDRPTALLPCKDSILMLYVLLSLDTRYWLSSYSLSTGPAPCPALLCQSRHRPPLPPAPVGWSPLCPHWPLPILLSSSRSPSCRRSGGVSWLVMPGLGKGLRMSNAAFGKEVKGRSWWGLQGPREASS